MTEELKNKILNLIEEKHIEEAINLCNESIEKDNKDEDAYFYIAICKFDLKNYEESIKYFNKVIELNPNNEKAYFYRGIDKNYIGLYNDAINDFSIAISIIDSYINSYNNRDLFSNIVQANPNLNNFNFDNNFLNVVTESAIKIIHNHTNLYNKILNTKQIYLLSFYNRALSKMYLKLNKEAFQDFNIATQLNPTFVDAYFSSGLLKSNLAMDREAIEDYNKVIRLQPNHIDAYINIAISYSILNRYDKAIEYFNKAISIDKNYYFIYLNRGIIKAFYKKYEEAIEDFNIAIEKSSNSFIAYFNKSQSLYNLKLYEESVKNAEKAIKLNNRYIEAHYIKMSSKAKLKKDIEIIDDLNNAAKINPNLKNNFITDMMNLLETYSNIETIFQLLIKDENIILWKNEPITNLLSRFDESKNFDDELKKNIKYLLLYEYFLLKILTFYSEKENDKIEISHYTSLDILPLLLNVKENIKESGNIRINNITTANDPKEGKILESIFNKNNIDIKIENDEKALTLQTSYSRNKDSLTMFRLYGKKENKEATGICLVLDNKYFNDSYTSPYSYNFILKIKNNQIEMNEKINKEKSQENKRNLYWVLYYNEKENQLIYNKEKSKYASNIIDLNDLNNDDYKSELKEDDTKENMIKYAFAKIFHYTKEIKKQIEGNENYKNIKNQLYSYLFENIKYIIKHEAFFEEQELRMLVTNDYKSDEILIDNDKKKLYIDYMPLFDERNNYIKEIIIGSKVENNEAVAEYIRKVLHTKNTEMNKLDDIKVSISEAPLR
ncbi:tetratricopeptide repeat protein [Brachyspira pilosicoli]|uniref:Tetratricopeptide repeat protein n=1 Tax=Brachyspira pilosicoli TaxID=52584 RepID=A0AAJ6K7G0_BRAPL|nr:tetratricopeptide repeat protein [Brachyspira pilosicoli]WIH89606.1 tetratricopeptide repeat protein [Brachyspira pilosicoli]WIH91901.1 tetratricopeptide repeat protein [Brachyspira pilosicoli]WIH94130.1 tetratricopeptide repeat protein [Brachyspira pilosicoli]